jgi:hypothetical protein
VLAADLGQEPWRQLPPVAGVQAGQLLQEAARERGCIADALGVQKRLDAVGVRGSLLDQAVAFAVRALLVFLLDARHMHEAAGVRLAAKVSEKRAHDALKVDPIGLGPARAAVDLDAGGIDSWLATP